MEKTKLEFSIVIILTAIISIAFGCFVGYTIGLFNMYHADGMNSCLVLFEQSRLLSSNIDSSGVNVNGLLDAIERNGDDWAAMVKAWQPHCRAKDEKTFSLALERWESAKKKLEDLRSSSPDKQLE
jgi:hypothetical protein